VRTRLGLALAVLALAAAPASAQVDLDRLLRGLGKQAPGGLSEARITDGLKEALQVGTANAVNLTGRVDGYFSNQAIKILMPSQLRQVETGLRVAGQGARVDEFVLSMNRAAEQAAPQARKIFVDAISSMTFEDAQRILSGGDTAATEYFKKRTTPQLTAAFKPVVEKKLGEVGVTRQYRDLLAQARAVPFLRVDAYDIDTYVVGKSLDGLFVVVGEEEKKIRHDPAARVTELLKDVFGH